MARKKNRTAVKYDMGPEPSKIETVSDLLRAYQWYNYEYTVKQGRKFVTDYVKTSGTPGAKYEASRLNSLKDSDFTTTICWQARMAKNGILPESSLENFKDSLVDLLNRARLSKTKLKKVVSVNKPTVQDRIREQVSSWIADIEDEIDALGTTVKTTFNPYEFLKTVDAKPVHVNYMLEYYRPQRDEVVEALAGKDAQLNEAYRYLSKAALKRLVDFFETLIADMERVINNKKVTRKPRKAKVKTSDQLTKSVKYLPESNEYKIVSVNSEKLIGANQVWLFNTKYRALSVYNALDGGLTVKGTTLQNFNIQTSVVKRVRKPEEALQEIQKSGKVALRKLMDTFKTKASEGTGRINKDTIIVRVV